MTSDVDLSEIVMALYAAGGQIAGAVSGKVHHARLIDWPLVLTLAEVLRINAATLALTAEHQIEAWQGLSNVTLEPTLFGDHLPGDVADGVQP